MPTVAELEEQLKAARALEEQAKQQLAEQARKEKLDAEILLTNGYLATLKDHLANAGIVTEVEPSKVREYGGVALGGLKIPDLNDFSRSVELDHRGGGYALERSYQFTVGDYGNRKIYARLKDGSFKYERIVEDVVARVRFKRARDEREAREEANRTASSSIVDILRTRFGYGEYSSVLSASTTNAEQVHLKLDLAVSREQAEIILQAVSDATRQQANQPQAKAGSGDGGNRGRA